MNTTQKNKMLKMKKIAIGFCALMATLPMAVIAVGLHKNNHEIVKLGIAGSVLTGMFIGMSDFTFKNSLQKKKTRSNPSKGRD